MVGLESAALAASAAKALRSYIEAARVFRKRAVLSFCFYLSCLHHYQKKKKSDKQLSKKTETHFYEYGNVVVLVQNSQL